MAVSERDLAGGQDEDSNLATPLTVPSRVRDIVIR